MYHPRVIEQRQLFRILAATVLIGLALISITALRRPILRSAGWGLVVEEPIQTADVIVVTADSGAAGVLEAADLVRGGIARTVAVLANPPNAAAREFVRRGIPYEDAAARSARQLRALGIANVEQIPRAVTGTEDEGQVLPKWCDQRQLRSVVVVSTSDHSRRVRRVLRRAMKGHRTSVTIRPARYSDFDPDQWWRTRLGIRTEIFEFEKLLLDLVRHPIS